jgi:hypothetical protein
MPPNPHVCPLLAKLENSEFRFCCYWLILQCVFKFDTSIANFMSQNRGILLICSLCGSVTRLVAIVECRVPPVGAKEPQIRQYRLVNGISGLNKGRGRRCRSKPFAPIRRADCHRFRVFCILLLVSCF